MTDQLASESTYLRAWRAEIQDGILTGILTHTCGRADLRSINMLPEDHADMKEKQGK